MRQLVVRPQAALEFAEAVKWYRKHSSAAATGFFEAVQRILHTIQRNPFQYQAMQGSARRVAGRGVLATSRDPGLLRDRLK